MSKTNTGLSKDQQIAIIAICVGAVITIIVAAITLGNMSYSDRPILSVSLGENGHPPSELHKEGSNYDVGISIENSGKRDGKVIFVLTGTNVKVSLDKNGTWAYEEKDLVKIPPHSPRITPLYLLPDNNASLFTVKLALDDSPKEFQQDTNLLRPNTLQYERAGSVFFLVSTLPRAPGNASAPGPIIMTMDMAGNAITGPVKPGQQIQVTTELANRQDREQPFSYLLQIQDANGVTVSLSWINGTLTAGQSLNPLQYWTPTASGNYTAQIFVWQSIDNPNALSPPLSTTITVQ